MTDRSSELRRVCVLIAALLLAPSFAHTDHPHAAQQEQNADPATDAAPPADDAPVMTMPWPTDAPGGMVMDHDARPTTFAGRLMAWLGGWHPAVIHFPIALLLTIAFLELAAVLRRKPLYAASNKLLLAIGTLGAFLAAPLGWANAGLPAADDADALVIHRWLGTAIPFLMLLLWWLKPHAEAAAKRVSPPFYEIVLIAGVLAILVQSYFGAEVTHGSGHMAF